jgi:hypothetical protein
VSIQILINAKLEIGEVKQRADWEKSIKAVRSALDCSTIEEQGEGE